MFSYRTKVYDTIPTHRWISTYEVLDEFKSGGSYEQELLLVNLYLDQLLRTRWIKKRERAPERIEEQFFPVIVEYQRAWHGRRMWDRLSDVFRGFVGSPEPALA